MLSLSPLLQSFVTKPKANHFSFCSVPLRSVLFRSALFFSDLLCSCPCSFPRVVFVLALFAAVLFLSSPWAIHLGLCSPWSALFSPFPPVVPPSLSSLGFWFVACWAVWLAVALWVWPRGLGLAVLRFCGFGAGRACWGLGIVVQSFLGCVLIAYHAAYGAALYAAYRAAWIRACCGLLGWDSESWPVSGRVWGRCWACSILGLCFGVNGGGCASLLIRITFDQAARLTYRYTQGSQRVPCVQLRAWKWP